MYYDLSILFFIKRAKVDKAGRAPIYCRITVNSERAELSINEKVEPDKWDCTIQKVKGKSELAKTINDRLEIVGNKIKSHFNSSIGNNELISAKLLKELLSGKKRKRYYLIQVFEENNNLIELEEGSKYVKSNDKQVPYMFETT